MFLSASIAAMINNPLVKLAVVSPLTLNSLLINSNIGCVTSAKVLVSPAFRISSSVNVTSVKELGVIVKSVIVGVIGPTLKFSEKISAVPPLIVYLSLGTKWTLFISPFCILIFNPVFICVSVASLIINSFLINANDVSLTTWAVGVKSAISLSRISSIWLAGLGLNLKSMVSGIVTTSKEFELIATLPPLIVWVLEGDRTTFCSSPSSIILIFNPNNSWFVALVVNSLWIKAIDSTLTSIYVALKCAISSLIISNSTEGIAVNTTSFIVVPLSISKPTDKISFSSGLSTFNV